MHITATVRNAPGTHHASVATDGATRELAIAPRETGPGSSVNGGELLMLALATCYCNDLYREAARMGVPIDSLEVVAHADFAGVGLAASHVRYTARVRSPASDAVVDALLKQTDAVAEIHNTLRAPVVVSRRPWQEA